MSVTIPSPLTGAAQTGLTSPTYTNVSDVSAQNQKTVAVTALGGTQTNVRVHAPSDPFTLTVERPLVLKTLGSPNPVTGVYANVQNNVYVLRTRKGANIAANQAPRISLTETRFSVPAGADAYDAVNVRAGISAHIGLAWAQSSGLGDTCVQGVL